MTTPPLLEHIVQALQAYDPERIILFGSRAWGIPDNRSDVDLVIIKETAERFLDRLKTVYQLLHPRYALDVLVYTPAEFQNMLEDGNAFIERITAQGKVLYERPRP